jgi:hypothetical protein
MYVVVMNATTALPLILSVQRHSVCSSSLPYHNATLRVDPEYSFVLGKMRQELAQKTGKIFTQLAYLLHLQIKLR